MDKPWGKYIGDIYPSKVIEDIKNATVVCVFSEYMGVVVLTRDIPEKIGCFVYESGGQRYGRAFYNVYFDTGEITITETFANSDWGSKAATFATQGVYWR